MTTTEQRIREARTALRRAEAELRREERELRVERFRAAREHSDTGALRAAMKEMDDTMDKHAELGACDTEPGCVHGQAMYDALHGNRVEIPTSGRGWCLYSGMAGVGQAGRELAKASRAVVKEIKLGLGNDNVETFIRGHFS